MERKSKHHDRLESLASRVDVQMIGDVRTFTSDESYMIGEGSYGTSVFLGIEANDNAVAVKRIVTSTTARSKSLDEEVQLLKLLKSNRSEHTVHYREFKPEIPYSYLILDLCEETLADFVKRNSKRYLETEGTMIIKEILTGLLELHSQKILHMDLKPQNILVNIDSRMLLSDFGISQKLKDDDTTVRTDSKGTLGWMAVESLSESSNKGRFKKKSDVQVAGMVSFYVLTKGGHPFGDRHHRTSNIIDGDPVDLMKLTNATARRFVKWLIAHNTKDRPYVEEALQDVFLQSNTAEDSHKENHVDGPDNGSPVSLRQASSVGLVRQPTNSTDDFEENDEINVQIAATCQSFRERSFLSSSTEDGQEENHVDGPDNGSPVSPHQASSVGLVRQPTNSTDDFEENDAGQSVRPLLSSSRVSSPELIKDIPYLVLQRIYRLLNIESRLGGDYRTLAGMLEMETSEIRLLQQQDNPCEEVLKWWEPQNSATVHKFREILSQMGRNDVVEILNKRGKERYEYDAMNMTPASASLRHRPETRTGGEKYVVNINSPVELVTVGDNNIINM